MKEEQAILFSKLTRLQKRVCLNVLDGMSNVEAYRQAGGKAKGDGARASASEILSNLNVCRFIESMEKTAIESTLCRMEDVVIALMNESGLGKDVNGNPIIPPEDTRQAARVAALKTLTDFTGGFDKNKQQIEHSGYVSRPLSELYEDDGD